MRSLCFEIKLNCHSCGNPIPINAFTEKIFCNQCNNVNDISSRNWKSLVVENIKDASGFADGEGQNSKIIGEYEFTLLFGKQKARCSKCKTSIPDDVFNNIDDGNYNCSKCGINIYIRKPSEFIKNIIPELKFLVGEDPDQLIIDEQKTVKTASDKPVNFNCPSCAANLEIDGTVRLITCKFCESKIYLPDDLWFSLHPARTSDRWYVLLDDSPKEQKIPHWNKLSDTAIDKSGNVYIASSNHLQDEFIIWSVGPDLKIRWFRNGLNYDYDTTGIAVTNDNKLLVWCPNKRSLLVLSCDDGKDIKRIKGENSTKDNPYSFNLKGCNILISDSDNTMLAVINNKFVRFYDDGSRAPVWKVVSKKGEIPGFFSRLFLGGSTKVKIPADEESAPYLHEIFCIPRRIAGHSTKINLGYDGYIYMLDSSSDGVLAKYARNGKKIWKKEIPLYRKDCKPYADKEGYVYIIGDDKNYRTKLLKFSPDGRHIEAILNDVLDGGPLCGDTDLALAPNGTIYTFRYFNILRAFNPDLTLKFETEQCKKDAKEKIDNYKKQQESEE